MSYPEVASEAATLAAGLSGKSLARYGDGELRLAAGGWCTSQRAEPGLREELTKILVKPPAGLLPCIPNWRRTPRKENWRTYAADKFTRLYADGVTYGSSFITRPDSAPWIDVPHYWDAVRTIWRSRRVVLVIGDMRSLRPDELKADGARLKVVEGPSKHAYAEADLIEARVLSYIREDPDQRVILCLGAAATCLAARLCARGVHALDLGHIGMFMRHAGAYRHSRPDLLSAEYLALIRRKHKQERWGVDGKRHADEVLKLARKLGAHVVLDYGSGAGTLGAAIRGKVKVIEYDPGIEAKAAMPKPVDLVVCTDVLEHVEPDKLDAVLDHIFRLAGKGVYLSISTRPAKHELPDGRNAHLIVEAPDWWDGALRRAAEASGGWQWAARQEVKHGLIAILRRG